MTPRVVPPKEAKDVLTVLAVGRPLNQNHELRDVFAHSNWVLLEAEDSEQALNLLRNRPVGVVVCDSQDDRAGWKRLLDRLSNLAEPPNVVVTSRNADESLWAEVLNYGGFDVLARPFDPREVVRVLGLAWLNWKSHPVPA